MAKQGLAARGAAAELLHAVLYDGEMMNVVLEAEDGPLAYLEPAERARAQSLALTTLRNLARIDAVLANFVKKQPPLAVQNILRLCTVELLIDGIAPHGAVDAAVNLVKSKRKIAFLSGLTNAVARKLVAQGAELLAAEPPQALPKSYRGRMVAAFGAETVEEIEVMHQQGAPVDLTLKDAARCAEYAEKLNAKVMPNGSLRLRAGAQLSRLDGFETGDWWVQDAAATIPVKALGDVSGKLVLDMCAAPGGKTMQLAALGANVSALDISTPRLERVRQNLKRTQLEAKVFKGDALHWKPQQLFDSVLIDAPCSATGTIRRHPDLPFAKRNIKIEGLLKLQRQMIQKAAEHLKPNGTLVYSTCSLFFEEGDSQVAWVMKKTEGLELMKLNPADYGLPTEAATKLGCLRLRPDMWREDGGMDGFFIAKFVKTG